MAARTKTAANTISQTERLAMGSTIDKRQTRRSIPILLYTIAPADAIRSRKVVFPSTWRIRHAGSQFAKRKLAKYASVMSLRQECVTPIRRRFLEQPCPVGTSARAIEFTQGAANEY